MTTFDVEQFRRQFPILERLVNGKSLIYFDNAATSQKPLSVIQSVETSHRYSNANVHRASHTLSSEATSIFEENREHAKTFINASSSKEIIWTKGTTEAINLVAQTWGRVFLSAGDEILLSYAEHHANIVPWQYIAEQTGAIIKVLGLDERGVIDLSSLEENISTKTKIVSVCHVSNVIGKINPIETIIAKAKSVGAITLIDGAQAVAHLDVDVKALGCDFYVFSGHKMYAPTGLGILYGKQEHLEAMPPYQFGGEMIKQVSFSGTTYNDLPFKFEAGTPNISGVAGLGQSIKFLIGSNLSARKQRHDYEQILTSYCYQQLLTLPKLKFLVDGQPDVANFAFNIEGFHPQDIATFLDAQGVAVRSGHHCAMPLMEYLKEAGCVRWSLAPYNTMKEVDIAIKCLRAFISDDPQSKVSAVNKPEIETIVTRFKQARSWDSKHRELMLFGKALPRLPCTDKTDTTLISGCESEAWLTFKIDEQGKFHFQADSNAKVIRGLLYVTLAQYEGLNAEQVLAIDIEAFFAEIGLIQHLSPSRGNGLKAIVKRIKRIATESFNQ
jgi:cysteine desulfurase / selenocysteine lyase